DEPFTIFAPENGNETLPPAEEGLLTHPDLVKRLLLDHIVLGVKIDLQLSSELTFSTLGGRTVQVQTVNGTLYANGARVIQQRVEVPHGILVILDNYLFPEDMDVTNMTSTPSVVGDSMTGESLVKVTAEAAAENNDVAVETTVPPVKNSTGGFLESVTQVLSFLKSGVKVFRQFLAKSNVSHLLMDDLVALAQPKREGGSGLNPRPPKPCYPSTSFLSLSLLKSYMRNSTNEDRLNGLHVRTSRGVSYGPM
ncbi:unnamed protein product, partial [Timema podura]|nr:unnamed protein product [Timema podura]